MSGDNEQGVIPGCEEMTEEPAIEAEAVPEPAIEAEPVVMDPEAFPVTPKGSFVLTPQNKADEWALCQKLAQSQFCPKAYRGKPFDVALARDMGQRVGLNLIQSLQSIAVINGKPSLYGDAVIAVVQAHPDFEDLQEDLMGKDDDEKWWGWRVTAKRRGRSDKTQTFTSDSAKAAGLLGKEGPWRNYPQRMGQWRARSWALRDQWSDVLSGLSISEEMEDVPSRPSKKRAGEVQDVVSMDAEEES